MRKIRKNEKERIHRALVPPLRGFSRGTRLRQDYGAAGREHQPSLTAVAKAMAGQEAMAWQVENS